MPHAFWGWAVPSASTITFVKSPSRSSLEQSIAFTCSLFFPLMLLNVKYFGMGHSEVILRGEYC